MTAADVTIVPMTVEMIPQITKIHFDAFAGYMNTRIGNAYIRKFMDWFRRAGGAIALVAVDSDNKAIGYVVGAPLGYAKVMNRDLLWVATIGLLMRPWLFFSRQFRGVIMNRLRFMLNHSLVQHAEPELPEPVMSLVGIGVSPSARGMKVGLRLMQAFEARSRELQARSLRLSVYPDNLAACRLYENCGWQPFSRPIKEKEAMSYFRILTRELDDRKM